MFPGIFLGPTGNCQGTHKVFDINMVVVKNPLQSLPYPCRAGSSKLLKIGEDATKRKTRQSPSNSSIKMAAI
jgi:hypothetical protein